MPDPLAAMRANMRAFYRLLGRGSPAGELIERDGLVASVVPACPQRSILNAVVYEHPRQLAEAHAELARRYEDAGVRAWTVWVPAADRESARVLERAGHRLDASPRAMTLELPTPATAGVREIEWEHTSDTAVAAELNEDAYGLPRGEFAAAMTALSSGPATIYLAALDGRPAATLATLEEGGDCGVYLVATAPRARRRGLASALLSAALEEARAHGCVTSSLQATRAGFPVYERLGYRDRGALEMWERRFA